MDEKEYDDVGEEKSSDIEKEAPGGISTVSLMTAKILSLISYLLSQPGIKSAILQLISMRLVSMGNVFAFLFPKLFYVC